MSRRRTSRAPGLPAAAALAGGITSAHRAPPPPERLYDHPRLLTEREATRERERLELGEWTELREVRLRAEILLDTAPESPVFRERREQLRVALERAVFEADRLTRVLRATRLAEARRTRARRSMTRDEAAQALRTHLQGWVSYHAGRGREGADEAHLMAWLARDYARVAALSGGPSTGSDAVSVRVGPVREEVSSDVTCWTQLALLGADRDGLHDLARAAHRG